MTTYAPYPAALRETRARLGLSSVVVGAAVAILHAPLAIAMRHWDILATAHALATLLACIAIGIFSRRAVYVLGAMSYIAGAEVLWRMCKASIFWEFGKYSVCLLLIIALFRLKELRLPKLALLYFALLLPACLKTVLGFGIAGAVGQISFDLSGPLTLLLALCFLRNVSMTRTDLTGVLASVLPPTLGIAAIALSTSYGAEIRFTGASNKALSGGFGPNQVASALALGALAALWIVFTARPTGVRKLALIALSLGLYAQSAITFSRSGVYLTGTSVLVAILMLSSDRRYRGVILSSMLVLVVGAAVVLPLANSFTGGHLLTRFQRKDITNRDVLMFQDLSLWQAYPFFGAGVGNSDFVHWKGVAAHTEYTRLLAEHGTLGLFALASLLLVAYGRWRRYQGQLEKAFVVSMFGWFFLYIGVNGMRLVAPIFVLGLGYAQWKLAAPRAATVRER